MSFRYASEGVSLGNSMKHGYQQEETRVAAEVARKLEEAHECQFCLAWTQESHRLCFSGETIDLLDHWPWPWYHRRQCTDRVCVCGGVADCLEIEIKADKVSLSV